MRRPSTRSNYWTAAWLSERIAEDQIDLVGVRQIRRNLTRNRRAPSSAVRAATESSGSVRAAFHVAPQSRDPDLRHSYRINLAQHLMSVLFDNTQR